MIHTITDLEPDLFDGYVKGWSDKRMNRFHQVLAGHPVRPTEPMITDLLAAAQGNLGADVARIFLDAVGRHRQSVDGLVLVTGAEFRSWNPGSCTHVPDIVVCRQGTWDPVIIIEGKMLAWVNGGHGYCQQTPAIYSNQVIAYTQDCWTTTPLDDVSFLWVPPRRTSTTSTGPGRTGASAPTTTRTRATPPSMPEPGAGKKQQGTAGEDSPGKTWHPASAPGRAVKQPLNSSTRGPASEIPSDTRMTLDS